MDKAGLHHIEVFSFKELKHITKDFSEELGRGGSGVVYKGVLDNNEVIAVKRLHNSYDSCGKRRGNGEAEFRSELLNLFGVRHQNIIRLVGYCCETYDTINEWDGKYVLASQEERILCVEYMQGGSLKDRLNDESCQLEWHTRYNIIKGVCQGLKYLHTGCGKPIYHLDLKPDNIWLDGNMMPKIGDFGISRLPPVDVSTQTYSTEKDVSGTRGYMAPEYMFTKTISKKCDVYSLGWIMLRVIAGEKGAENYDTDSPGEFIEHVHEIWAKRHTGTMPSHLLQQIEACTKIALRCVEFDRTKRPTITEIVDELNKIDAAESSAVGSQITGKEGDTTFGKQPDFQEPEQKGIERLVENLKVQADDWTKKDTGLTMSIRTSNEAISSINECASFFQLIKSAISSLHLNGSKEKDMQDRLLQLESILQRLSDTLPAMYILIDRAEWRSHEHYVAELLPKLKDAVCDADDLLDEFNWHERNVQLKENATESAIIEFFDTIYQGSFNKLTDVKERLDHLSSQLEKMGLRDVTQRFDKAVRPETSSLPNEAKIFGRDKELKQVMGFLNVTTGSKRKRASVSVNASTSTIPSNQLSNESRTLILPVLPIVGIGGVGKTTLAQQICDHKQVKSHFSLIVWICVSDNFDVKRLTKEFIQSCPGKKSYPDNLDSLQRNLSNKVKDKRLLIVLDDIWEDALKENVQCWKRFCAPLLSAQEGSMMLVTTRCSKVAEQVCTMKPLTLEGLKENVFWDFFKLCAFGSESSNNDPELECIGRNILPKLKGSPLAAKTLGRMLRMDLHASHWNSILESELWKLKQEVTDILPALRLSYMYLPFYLKRCFSFCAVYPKDYKFLEENLAEVWAAEGFVEPQGDDYIQKTSCHYFQELVCRSFFQKVSGGYVIHDLLHDMAQKVSEHDCFILRNKKDFQNVPPNVRHIYVHPSSDFDNSDLLSLCKHPKLRTIICKKQSGNKTSTVMDQWCTKLLRIRVISCASTNELPNSIGNWKHLRYLKVSIGRPLSIPPTFSLLYHLQIFCVRKCKIESFPDGFSKLSNLQIFAAQGLLYDRASTSHIDASKNVQGVRLMKNLNQFCGDLVISNVQMISKDDAEEAKLKSKKNLNKLTLIWYGQDDSQIMHHNPEDVLQALQPPPSLRSLLLKCYPGVSLPRWLQPHMINLNDSIGILPSLADLTISWCQNLSSLEGLLHPDSVPAITKVSIHNCKSLLSVATERFRDLIFLEVLEVRGCPNFCSQSLVSPSLKKLELVDCESLFDNFDCSSLTNFTITKSKVTSIQTEGWILPAVQELKFLNCPSLISIELSVVNGLTQEYLPAIERIHIALCHSLMSVPGEWFRGLSSLKHLHVEYCEKLIWPIGLVLPSSLKTLVFEHCGDISPSVPGCLENLTSLVSLDITGCQGMMYIPGTIWRDNLALLEELVIRYCPNIVSIGGAEAVSHISSVRIYNCPNLKEAEEIKSVRRHDCTRK